MKGKLFVVAAVLGWASAVPYGFAAEQRGQYAASQPADARLNSAADGALVAEQGRQPVLNRGVPQSGVSGGQADRAGGGSAGWFDYGLAGGGG